MAEEKIVPQYTFSHQEVLRALIREKGLRTGRWGLAYELTHAATTINALKQGETQPVITPASLVLIQQLALFSTLEVNALTADAAEVNPPHRKSRRRSTKKSAK